MFTTKMHKEVNRCDQISVGGVFKVQGRCSLQVMAPGNNALNAITFSRVIYQNHSP